MSVNKLKQNAKELNLAFLILSEENVKYFTGFLSSNGWLLVTAEKSVFLTDSRYIEAAVQEISTVDEVLETKGFESSIVPLIKSLGVRRLALESERVTLAQYAQLQSKLNGVEIVTDETLDDIINAQRRSKSEKEVELIVKAQRIAEKGFEHILKFIKPGLSEKQVQLELDYFMLKNGADGLSFETIAVAGANGSKPHGVPGNNIIQSGNFITLDFGALYMGYHSDMTRTVAVGQISDKQAEVYQTVLKAQLAGIEAINPGTPCKEADDAARKVITEAGYGEYFGHGFGHGVGVEIHEHPFESQSSSEILQAGDIVTAEPGIYLPGKFGVRIEDMLLVTESGSRNLTESPKQLIVL